MRVRAGAVLVTNYVFASMHYEQCVPVISKRTSTSAEMQCMPQTKLSAWFINHELCVCVDKLRTMYLSCPRKHASYTRMECMLQMLVRTAGVFVKMWVYASMRCKLCTCHFKENTHITHENGVHVADVGTHCWCVSHKLNFVCVCAEEDRRTASA